MSLVKRVQEELQERRKRLLEGKINCIPSPFKRFANADDFIGIEKHQVITVTSFTKGGKCFGKGTLIRMSDNSLKKVEDIKVGDKVLSPNSEPSKEVIGINKGTDTLYEVTSMMYNSFKINSKHILYVYDAEKKEYKTFTAKDMYEIYLTMPFERFSRKYKMVASDEISFEENPELAIEPYFYGLWLGDGETHDTPISTESPEIIEYIEEYADKLGLGVSINDKGLKTCKSYRIRRKHHFQVNFKTLLESVSHWDKSHINRNYMVSSIESRYQLLAGLIDTDGYLNPNKSGFEICLQLESLIDDIISLSRSLGLTCRKSEKYDKKYKKYYYIASICGVNCSKIPTRIKKIKNPTRVNRRFYSFKMKECGIGEFYGFEVGGNHLFLLKDYTIVHNSQFSSFVFLYYPLLYAFYNPEKVRVKVLYFNLEETQERVVERFMSYLLYQTKGWRFSPSQLRSTKRVLPKEVMDSLENDYKDVMNFFENNVTFSSTGNPTGIYKECKQFMEERGTTYYKTYKKKNEFGVDEEFKQFDYYIPNDSDEYVIIFIDHIGIIDREKSMTMKESMDKLSEYLSKYMRNRYHCTPIIVQQQSFESEGLTARINNQDSVTVSGLGDSKYTARDSNIVLALDSPFRTKKTFYEGYDITRFKDNIRFLKVLINRDGAMGGTCPLFFDGAVCNFEELPRPEDTEGIARYYKRMEEMRNRPAVTNHIITKLKKLFKQDG